ncbi:MAG: pinensin family lanthipeptide [Bacteroidota bacterium]
MKSKKMKLDKLEVSSFTTTLKQENINTIKGGATFQWGNPCGPAPSTKPACYDK